MHYINKIVLSSANGSTLNGDTLDSNQWVSCSFQIVTGGTADGGTVKLQMSNDQDSASNMAGPANFQPTNWSDIPSATSTVTAGVGSPITIANSAYRWLRAVYTKSAGTDAVTIQVFAIYP